MPAVDGSRVMVILGGGRPQSHTATLAARIVDELALQGASPDLWDADGVAPPDVARRTAAEDHPDPTIRELAERCRNAQAFVWVTPVFHNSYSSHLKSVLDHLDSSYFARKVVGLASHGKVRTPQAMDHLRIVARSLHAVAAPNQNLAMR